MPSSRLNYIDALKGVAIFTVVYSHILIFCLLNYPESFIVKLLRLFYLNGFFFISGYFFYKPIETYNNERIKVLLFKKFTVLFIPTLITGAVYWYSHGIDMVVAIFDTAKMGYWFTFVLFEMFVLIAFLMWVGRFIKGNGITELIILSLLGLITFLIIRYWHLKVNSFTMISAYNLCFYCPIFIIGMLCRKFDKGFQIVLNSKAALTICFCVVILSFVLSIPSFVVSVGTVLLAFCLANQSKDIFINTQFGRFLSYLGNYTMEIYFIHYFLLFEMPKPISQYLSQLSMTSKSLSFPEFLIVGPTAIIICICSVFIALLLRKIPYVGKLSLGK